MATATLRFSELQRLSAAERQARFREFQDAMHQPMNGQLCELDEQIRAFEARYEMPSDEMYAKFKAGELHETYEICRWLMLVELRRNATSANR